MHASLIPHLADALEKPLPPPPCPIMDFHMHAGPAASNRDYVRAAREYGVVRALAMTHNVTPEALASAYGDFFCVCQMLPLPGTGDGAAWTRRMLRQIEDLRGRGVVALKFKVEPSRGRPQAFLDDPRLAPVLARAAEIGFIVMAHIAQPSAWWPRPFDPEEVGSKDSYFVQVENVLRDHPSLPFVGVHMGGYPERLDYLDRLLAAHPNFFVDTSATKWVVRELSRRREAARAFFLRFPDRILFGSDLVVMFGDCEEYFTSRFHVQRTMWESDTEVGSMIHDPDATGPDFPEGPFIRPLALPEEVLRKLYWENATRLLQGSGQRAEGNC